MLKAKVGKLGEWEMTEFVPFAMESGLKMTPTKPKVIQRVFIDNILTIPVPIAKFVEFYRNQIS